jgi:hypothetical protein
MPIYENMLFGLSKEKVVWGGENIKEKYKLKI